MMVMAKKQQALALGSATAFVTPSASSASVAVRETKADLEALCANNPSALGFEGIWDPLGCADYDFWNLGNEGTIGYLRHAEIKHGRVAMAGFLGFLAQSTPLVSGEHILARPSGVFRILHCFFLQIKTFSLCFFLEGAFFAL